MLVRVSLAKSSTAYIEACGVYREVLVSLLISCVDDCCQRMGMEDLSSATRFTAAAFVVNIRLMTCLASARDS